MSDHFCIFAFPRTGSSTLRLLLNMHDDISCAGELFNWGKMQREDTNTWYPEGLSSIQDISQEEMLSMVQHAYKIHTGFKHIQNHVCEEYNRTLIAIPDHKIIFLWRRNLVQNILSRMIARKAGYWLAKDKEKLNQHTFEDIDLRKFTRQLEKYKFEVSLYRNVIQQSGNEYLELQYEDLFSDLSDDERLATLNRVFEFLGKTPMQREQFVGRSADFFHPKKKINSEDTYKKIPNIHEIEEQFASDEHGRVFTSVA